MFQHYKFTWLGLVGTSRQESIPLKSQTKHWYKKLDIGWRGELFKVALIKKQFNNSLKKKKTKSGQGGNQCTSHFIPPIT